MVVSVALIYSDSCFWEPFLHSMFFARRIMKFVTIIAAITQNLLRMDDQAIMYVCTGFDEFHRHEQIRL